MVEGGEVKGHARKVDFGYKTSGPKLGEMGLQLLFKGMSWAQRPQITPNTPARCHGIPMANRSEGHLPWDLHGKAVCWALLALWQTAFL